MAEDKGFKRLATARSVLGAYQGVVVAVNREKARANADKLIRFIRAQIAGVEWLYAAQNRAEAITILRHNVPQLDEDVANRSYATMIAANTGFQRAAEVEMDGVRTVLALRSKYGRPHKTLTDLTRYLDLSDDPSRKEGRYARNAIRNPILHLAYGSRDRRLRPAGNNSIPFS